MNKNQHSEPVFNALKINTPDILAATAGGEDILPGAVSSRETGSGDMTPLIIL